MSQYDSLSTPSLPISKAAKVKLQMPASASARDEEPTRHGTPLEVPSLPFHARTKDQRQLRDLYQQVYDQKRTAGEPRDRKAVLERESRNVREGTRVGAEPGRGVL